MTTSDRMARLLLSLSALIIAGNASIIPVTRAQQHHHEHDTPHVFPHGSEIQVRKARREGAPARLLEEITVTARKREETVFEAPLAIAALSEDELAGKKVSSLLDLAVGMPNVALDEIGTVKGIANFSIRGLGVNSSIPSIDPTVGVFVDGVYMGTNVGVIYDTFDLENIQVLRGPQGTLFGRNVTGGAILVNTRKPADELEVNLRAALDGGGDGGLNKYLMGSASGPLSEDVTVKVAAYFNDDDGWFENQLSGKDFGAIKQKMVRPVIQWWPTATTDLILRYEYTSIKGEGSASQNHTSGFGISAPHNFARDSHDFSIDETGFQDTENHFFVAELNQDAGEYGTITNIFGYRRSKLSALSDLDAQPDPLLDISIGMDAEQISNELRYTGEFFHRIHLTTGLYYFNNHIDYHERRDLLRIATPDNSPATTLDGGGKYEVETYGLFAAVDYDLSYALQVNVGLRYTIEEKHANIASMIRNINKSCNVLDNTCPYDFNDSESWDSLAPKLGLTWHLSDNARVYGSWTRGFRSGGYNLRNTSQDTVNAGPGPFDQETLDNYEIGFKTRFGRALLDGALFFNDINDVQREINLPDPVSGVVQIIRNTADVEILGIELDGALSLTEALLLSASLGWIDPEYRKVKFDLNGDNVLDSRDKDLDLPRAAKWTYSLGLTHDWQVDPWGRLSARVNYSYRDESAFTDNNRGLLLSQKILDAGLDFHVSDGRWMLSVYGKNLLNEVKHGAAAPLAAQLGTVPLGGTYAPLGKGRIVGVEITCMFL